MPAATPSRPGRCGDGPAARMRHRHPGPSGPARRSARAGPRPRRCLPAAATPAGGARGAPLATRLEPIGCTAAKGAAPRHRPAASAHGGRAEPAPARPWRAQPVHTRAGAQWSRDRRWRPRPGHCASRRGLPQAARVSVKRP
jgi:hypothetical protein